MRFVRTFNILYAAIFGLLAAQPGPVAIRYLDSAAVSGSLDSLIHDDPDLTLMLDLHRIIVSDKKTEYKKSYRVKYLDTLVVRSTEPLRQAVLQQITKPLARIAIGAGFDQQVQTLHQRYYFLHQPVQYQFGLVAPDRLGGVVHIRPAFENQFSGILGMSRSGQIWNLTGEFDMHLENLLETAGSYDMYWKRVDSLSQILKFEFIEPHPFGLDFGINWNYHHEVIQGLYTFMENQTQFQVSMSVFPVLRLGFSVGKTLPTEKGRAQGYSEVSFRSFIVSAVHDETDHRFLPAKGYKYEFQLDGGKQNSAGFLEGQYQLANYFPMTNQSFLMFASQGKSIWSKEDKIPKTRFYYFGGASTLRGYREQQFFNTSYQVTTLELGYRPVPVWQGNLFIDYATTFPEPLHHSRLGYGLGFTQVSKQTIIKIQYAVPGSLDFQNGKLHINWISRL